MVQLVCADGWTKLAGDPSRCYSVTLHRYRWQSCRRKCEEKKAHLASIHSPSQNEAVLSFLKNEADHWFWIGAKRVKKCQEDPEGENGTNFYWIDFTNFGYTNWGVGEPDDSDEDCAQMHKSDGTWSVRSW